MFTKPTFGQTNPPAFGGFSSPGAATTGASTPFGQNTFNKPATSTTGFAAPSFGTGGSTMFGGASTSTGTGMFGNTAAPAFGQPAQPAQTGFSGFNTGASTPLFGSSTGVSSFAQPKPSFGGFGTNTSSAGLFGAQPTVSGNTAGQPGGSLFNQGSNMFGSSGGFGAPGTTGGAATLGTPIKFNAPTGTDSMAKNGLTQTINTRHQCITCMKEYENKSLEELRLEDMQAGRKGPTGGDGMFGPTAGTQPGQTSLFGSPSLAQPGTSSTGFGENKALFGSTATTNAALGAFGGGTTAFGSSTQTGGLFGKPAGFGTATTTASGGFSFTNNNNSTTTNPFGAAATQAKPFGAAAPTTSLFGTPQTSTGTMFGTQTNTGFSGFGAQQQQQQGIGLFGQPKPTTPFGMGTQQQPAASTTFGAFGQNTANNTQAGGLFGAKPQLGTGLNTAGFGSSTMFGAKPTGTTAAPAFGATPFGAATSTSLGGGTTSLFGQPFNKQATQAQPFSGFGQQTATTPSLGTGLTGGLFGSSSLAKPATTGGLFGTPAGNMFGGQTNTAQNTFGIGGGMSFGQNTNTGGLGLGQSSAFNFNKPAFTGLGSQLGGQSVTSAEDPHKRLLALCAYPYGDTPLLRNFPSDFSKLEEMRLKTTNAATQKAALNQSPAFNISTAKPKLAVSPMTSTPAKKSIFNGLDASPSILGSSVSPTPVFSARRLNIKPKVLKPGSGIESGTPILLNPDTPETNRSSIAGWLSNVGEDEPRNKRVDSAGTSNETPKTTKEVETELDTTVPEGRPARRLALDELPAVLNDSNASISLSFTDNDVSEERLQDESEVPREPHPAGIILTRSDYYTIPSMDELAKMTDENGHCIVKNFTIGRKNYGNIFFEDFFDIAGLDLDTLVHIRHKQVVVHPDDESKPPLGEGLNRRAQVTLDRVFPTSKLTRELITDPKQLEEMNYENHLRLTCLKMKVRFLDYLPDTGSWVFKVDHFSKYGVEDDDENEETVSTNVKKMRSEPPKPAQQKPPLKPKPVQLTPKSTSIPLQPPQLPQMMEPEHMDEGFPEARSPTDQLSRLAGMDTCKMRLMKASLFTMEDEAAEEPQSEMRDEGHSGPVVPIYDTPPPSVGPSVVHYDPEVQMMEEEGEKQERRPLQHPSLVTPSHAVVPLRQSLTLNYCLPDAALFNCRRFSVSWGPGSALLHSRGLDITIECPYSHTPTFKEWVQSHLEVQLLHTIMHDDGGAVPRRAPNEGLACLEDHCDTLQMNVDHDERERIIRQVLQLCLALWGELKALGDEAKPSLLAHERREAVSEWLQQVICEEHQDETKEPGLEKILQQLTRGNLLNSVKSCQEIGDHYSSMVLATAGSEASIRQQIQRQLQEWVSDSVSSLVHPDRLSCWLLAGTGLPLLSLEDGHTLNALQKLDWLSCLAAHLWYLCGPAASVPDILNKYEQAFKGENAYAVPPIPDGGSEDNLDVRFHLFKLFSQRTHPLEKLLSVETHFPNTPLDFSLSWLLLQLLDSLHYTHVTEHCAQGLHLAFAEQLEAAGLWHWAVFVLQHVSDPAMRSSAIEKVIGRHVTLDTSGWTNPEQLHHLEEFVVSRLDVPAKMVYQAKAYLAACRHRHQDTACYQLHAQDWSGCHQTIVKHLASDAIINEDSGLLLRLLRALRQHSEEIDGWESRGQVYLNYLSLLEEVRQRINLEAMHQRVSALMSQLSQLPSTTPKERLCQSEIARRTIAVARSLLLPGGDSSPGTRFTDLLVAAPMPDDYRLQELRQACRLVIQDM